MRLDPDSPGVRDRIRLSAAGLVLLTVAFAVSPGHLLPDTKLDMPVNPTAFLGRALHMWDPGASFGQVQNQAYGYFFPMGPFYLAGKLLGLAPWVTQRLWLALVLLTAYYGLVRLAAALEIGSQNSRLVAGFGYALAPRAQELLAANSSEFLPMAVLPWILLPLVRGAQGRYGPRRAAALSALAVVCCGGINATAEIAVLAVPLLYLLTRRNAAPKWRLLAWWAGCTAAATVWWLGPTYLMGTYIAPFLQYTESATTTTLITSLTNALRGADQWFGYLPVAGSPWWPAGNALSTSALPILVTAVLAAVGLYGLTRRDLPERAFLLLCLLLGTALVVSGHPGAVAAPFNGQIRDLLDGSLAPLRNVHKFDPLLRLPLILGLCHLMSRPLTRRTPAVNPLRRRPTMAGLGAAALALSMLPVLTPGLGTVSSPTSIPAYEKQAASWLNRKTGKGSVLAVPGQQFGRYTWGNVMDDPLQPLLDVRWASWTGVPYGSAGVGRLLQAVDQRFATGQGSAGLAEVLARMGVKYVLVRNDLDRGVIDTAYPARIHQAIAATPGLPRSATFGPKTGGSGNGEDQPFPALEIYRVTTPATVATPMTSRPLRVIGGPESLLTLADQGLLPPSRPVVFNDDTGADHIPAADTVVTDSLRRREVDFSNPRGGVSATMSADQPYTGSAKVKDILEPGWSRYQTVVHYSGIASVTASSSADDVASIPGGGSRGEGPFAALDGDSDTSWVSSGWHGAVGEWLRVGFDRPLDPGRISVAFSRSDLLGPAVSQVSVETAAGSLRQRVKSGIQTLAVPRGPTTWLRVRVNRTVSPAGPGTRVGISTLTIPGVTPGRALSLPAVKGALAFTNRSDATSPCMPGSNTWVCTPFLTQQSEDGAAFDRVFTGSAGPVTLGGSAVLTDLGLIRRYTATPGPQATASSVQVGSPVDDARSAFDGDLTTPWIAGSHDQNPRLTLDLGRTVEISRLTFHLPGQTKNLPFFDVTVSGSDGSWRSGITDSKGRFSFAPLRAGRLTITFQNSPGIQIADVAIPGVQPIPRPSTAPLALPCGSGPTVTLGGQTVQTRLTDASPAALLTGRAVDFTSCGTAPSLTTGRQHITVPATSPFRISEAVLTPTAPAAASAIPTASVHTWGSQSRSATVNAPAGGYLATAENFNAGWHATLGGRPLRAVLLDGWRQAWALPVGARGVVSMAYGPDRTYVIMLLVGLAMVLLVGVAALVPDRGPRSVLAAARPGTWWRWPIAVAFGLWAGGVTGLVLVPAVCALAPRIRRPALLVAGFVATAGGLLALNSALLTHGWDTLPGALADAVPQLLCLAALGLAIGSVPVRGAVPGSVRKEPGPGAGAPVSQRTGG